MVDECVDLLNVYPPEPFPRVVLTEEGAEEGGFVYAVICGARLRLSNGGEVTLRKRY